MRVWRVARHPFVSLSGEGARLYGGRWNRPGHPVVYTAENPALAVLEVRVHLDLGPDLIPTDYCLVEVEIGDPLIERIDVAPDEPATFGTQWLEQGRSPVLQVPSFIVPRSYNFLLNPRHAEASSWSVVQLEPFSFDRRLWLPL